MTTPTQQRLEELRQAIRDENISWWEIAELQQLGEQGLIPDHDVELREWAGIPEFSTGGSCGEDCGGWGMCTGHHSQ